MSLSVIFRFPDRPFLQIDIEPFFMAAAGPDIPGERIADQAQGRDSRKDPVHILFRQVRKVASVPLS